MHIFNASISLLSYFTTYNREKSLVSFPQDEEFYNQEHSWSKADEKGYRDSSNLSQELLGVGSKLLFHQKERLISFRGVLATAFAQCDNFNPTSTIKGLVFYLQHKWIILWKTLALVSTKRNILISFFTYRKIRTMKEVYISSLCIYAT